MSQLIDNLILQYHVDPARVYVIGMSNGGFMTYRLACEISSKITAIAPVSATMNVQTCTITKPVPVIHFHSFLDGSVPYLEGIGVGISSHYNPPTDSVLDVWRTLNKCDAPLTIQNNSIYTHQKWSNCACGHTMEYYITQDGGHSWHGGNKTGIGDNTSTSVSANDKMREFFQSNTVCNVGVEDLSRNSSDLVVTPNPVGVGELFTISSLSNDVTVYDMLGKVVLQSRESINLSIVLSGIYIVEITLENGDVVFQKLVVE